MSFSLEKIEALFPLELSEQRKGRLRDGLKQFLSDNNSSSKLHTDFYSQKVFPYFLQGDLVFDLRFPSWNSTSRDYSKIYSNAILLSNTCDIDEANSRNIPKQVMMIRLISLRDFETELKASNIKNSESILLAIRNQEYSNLMYFPPIYDEEYIAVLDEISWIGVDELSSLKTEIGENRMATLDLFGYYLFMFKISYHLCRLPEEIDR